MILRGRPRQAAVSAAGGALAAATWLAAGFLSQSGAGEVLLLAAAQGALHGTALWVMFGEVAQSRRLYGPSVMAALCVHALIFYGLANIVPALHPGLRPEFIVVMVTDKIPPSEAHAYIWATIAAVIFLLGLWTGSTASSWAVLRPAPRTWLGRPDRQLAWLPSHATALTLSVVLLILLSAGTWHYGLEFVTVLTDESVARLSLSQQLLFHGLLRFLPVAPALAGAAYVQASNARQRQNAAALVLLSSMVTILSLTIWRMRSTAMIAMIFLGLVLVWGRAIRGRVIVVFGGAFIVLVYVLVTAVKVSNLESFLDDAGATDVSLSDLVGAARARSGTQTIATRALADVSYRTAGLEGVAAILAAQDDGRLAPQNGRVILGGLEQALPSSWRSEFELPLRIKTAPSYLGLFREGDWVTTMLAEFAMDFGAWWLFPAAVGAGFVIATADRLMLRISRRRALEGLLVMRIPYLAYFILIGGSFGEGTLMFAKATIGFLAICLAASAAPMIGNALFRPKRAADFRVRAGATRHVNIHYTARAGKEH